jgi:hypothetical protein
MVDNTDVNVRGGMISLLARCVQCQKINNSQYHLTYLPLRKERRDAEGRVLCSASLVCPEPRERTTLRCVEHNGESVPVIVRYMADQCYRDS